MFETIDESAAVFQFASSKGSPVSKQGKSQKFKKEVIRIGEYVDDGAGVRFKITSDILDHWTATFSKMRQNGVKVWIPAGHTEDPDKNRGYVRDLFHDGQSLFMIAEMFGDDGIALASRSDVSLHCPPRYVDGDNNEYVRPIQHIACCTDPVIPGLGPWQAIAASKSGKKPLMFTSTKEIDVDKKQWAELRKAFAIEDKEADDDKTLELVFAATKKKDETLAELEKELTKTKGALSLATKKHDVNPTLVKLLGENRELKLNQLVEAARITPGTKTGLAKLYVDAAALTLSLGSGSPDQFDALFEILLENDPVGLKQLSGPQVLSLTGGPVADGDGQKTLLADAQARAKAATG